MLGVSFYARHLRKSGRAGLDDVVRHVVHLAQAAGGPERVGLGTDLDGGFDARQAPMNDLAELRELRERLTKRFNKTQVEGVMGGNWIEFLGRALPD
jgi:microsomal dipeptidase-like Zn-dependent dipeptidase